MHRFKIKALAVITAGIMAVSGTGTAFAAEITGESGIIEEYGSDSIIVEDENYEADSNSSVTEEIAGGSLTESEDIESSDIEADEYILAEDIDESGTSDVETVSGTDSETVSSLESSCEGTVSFSGNSATISDGASGITATTSDNGIIYVNISEDGSYTFNGLGNKVTVEVAEEVTAELTFSALEIDNSNIGEDLPFLLGNKKTNLTLILSGSSSITGYTGSGSYSEELIQMKAKSTLTIQGDSTGTLTIPECPNDAIKSKGTVNVESGTITITKTHGDGIQAEDINISGGTVEITTYYANAATGYYTSGSNVSGYNTITESGDTKTERINVDTGSHKALKGGTKAKTEIYETVDTTADNYEEDFADYTAGDEIVTEASGGITITGGTVKVDTTQSGIKANSLSTSGYTATSTGVYIVGSPDDGIQSNNTLDISGGTISVASADDGISAAGALTITGSSTDIDITTAYEGMEGAAITIGTKDSSSGPDIVINANDDGMNSSSKTLVYTYDSTASDDVYYTKKSTSATSGSDIIIYSGSVQVGIDSENTHSVELPANDSTATIEYKSSGDGIDCNGSLAIYGGDVKVFGQSSGDNTPVDRNDSFTLAKEANVLLAGASGMSAEAVPNAGDGVYVVYGGTGSGMPGDGEMPGDGGVPGNGQMPGSGEMPGNGQMSGSGTSSTDSYEIEEVDTSITEGPGDGNQGGPGEGSTGATIAAGTTVTLTDGSTTIRSESLLYAASFVLISDPDLVTGNSYTFTAGTTSQTLTAYAANGSNYGGGQGIADPNQNKYSQSTLTLTTTDESGNPVTITVTNSKSVSYDGMKHVISDNKATKSKINDIYVDVSSDITSYSTVKYKVKYNKNAASANAVKAPRIIVQFKANKTATKAQKKIIRAVNKELKKQPVTFDITACDLTKVTPEITLNKAETKIKKVTVTVDGKTIKLRKKKDYTASSLTEITGVGNFTGTYSTVVSQDSSGQSGDSGMPFGDGSEPPTAPGGDSGEAPTAPGGDSGEAPTAPGGDSGEAPMAPGQNG